MSNEELIRRYKEVRRRGLYSLDVLISRMQRTLREAGNKELVDSSRDLEHLSEEAAAILIEYLSHACYGGTIDVDRAAALAARKAS
jgi:hypothetical protein